jgi:hypothetical protein
MVTGAADFVGADDFSSDRASLRLPRAWTNPA